MNSFIHIINLLRSKYGNFLELVLFIFKLVILLDISGRIIILFLLNIR
jgi:hypothetical protein